MRLPPAAPPLPLPAADWLAGLRAFVKARRRQPRPLQRRLPPAAELDAEAGLIAGMLRDLLIMFRDVLPIIAVVLFFQYVVIRKHIAHLHKVMGGFMLVIIGLYAFVVGLKMGLFPIGRNMAEQ